MKRIIARIGEFVKHSRSYAWQAFCIGLFMWSAYNLGLIRAHRGALPAQESALLAPRAAIVSRTPSATGQGSQTAKHTDDPRVVVSKSSNSMKYHFSWCSGATRIKEANRVWYPTAQAAEAAGYTLAANCTR